MLPEVLIVDDVVEIREEIREFLESEGYACVDCGRPSEAIQLLASNPQIKLGIVDLRMPECNGFDFVAEWRRQEKSDVRVEFLLLSGHAGMSEAVSAMREGFADFLQKPFDPDALLAAFGRLKERLQASEAHAETLKRLRESHERLPQTEQLVSESHSRIMTITNELEKLEIDTLTSLACAADLKDPETGEHIERIGRYAETIGRCYGLSENQQALLRRSAPLHDVGKIGVPDAILLKTGKLTVDEVTEMKKHPLHGYDILRRVQGEQLLCAANIALYHHERWDGTGYPYGLSGSEIPLEARITAIVDVYDALRSERPYKEAFSHDVSMKIILEGDGRTSPEHFDPELLRLLRENDSLMAEIFEAVQDQSINASEGVLKTNWLLPPKSATKKKSEIQIGGKACDSERCTFK